MLYDYNEQEVIYYVSSLSLSNLTRNLLHQLEKQIKMFKCIGMINSHYTYCIKKKDTV